jgi:hypothetical protein
LQRLAKEREAAEVAKIEAIATTPLHRGDRGLPGGQGSGLGQFVQAPGEHGTLLGQQQQQKPEQGWLKRESGMALQRARVNKSSLNGSVIFLKIVWHPQKSVGYCVRQWTQRQPTGWDQGVKIQFPSHPDAPVSIPGPPLV